MSRTENPILSIRKAVYAGLAMLVFVGLLLWGASSIPAVKYMVFRKRMNDALQTDMKDCFVVFRPPLGANTEFVLASADEYEVIKELAHAEKMRGGEGHSLEGTVPLYIVFQDSCYKLRVYLSNQQYTLDNLDERYAVKCPKTAKVLERIYDEELRRSEESEAAQKFLEK